MVLQLKCGANPPWHASRQCRLMVPGIVRDLEITAEASAVKYNFFKCKKKEKLRKLLWHFN